MTLEQWRFQNPLDILLASEARSCKGCAHSAVVFDRQYCGKGKKHGRRCGAYQEKQNHQGEEMLRRVRKEEARTETWVKPDGLDLCLQLWKAWMGKADTDLGHQGQKSLRGDGDGYGNVDTSQSRRDNEIAEATDAMINSLRACDRWAIYRACSLSTIWNFPMLDYVETAQSAKAALEMKLRKNVATSTLFG